MKVSVIAGVLAAVLSSNVGAVEYIDNASTISASNSANVIESDNASTTAGNNATASTSDNASTGANASSAIGIGDNASTTAGNNATTGESDNAGTGVNSTSASGVGIGDNASTTSTTDNAATGETDNASTGVNSTSAATAGVDDNASTSTTVSQGVSNYGIKTNPVGNPVSVSAYGVKTNPAGVPVEQTPSSTSPNTSINKLSASHLDSNVTDQEREAAKEQALLNQVQSKIVNGKDGVNGEAGKDGVTTTIVKHEVDQGSQAAILSNSRAINTMQAHQDSFEQSTNKRFADLDKRVSNNEKLAKAAGSAAIAQANVPQVIQGQTFAAGVAVGGYSDQNAIAAGVSYRANESVVVKATISEDTDQNFGYGAGVSVGF
ncbi:YadA-like family protein [Salmonella enterica]|nr:YadA-like family protein [Salmonella enterica]